MAEGGGAGGRALVPQGAQRSAAWHGGRAAQRSAAQHGGREAQFKGCGAALRFMPVSLAQTCMLPEERESKCRSQVCAGLCCGQRVICNSCPPNALCLPAQPALQADPPAAAQSDADPAQLQRSASDIAREPSPPGFESAAKKEHLSEAAALRQHRAEVCNGCGRTEGRDTATGLGLRQPLGWGEVLMLSSIAGGAMPAAHSCHNSSARLS